MPQTRFVPGGRIVEEFIPDATDEGYQGFSGDRPQLAVDMFGQINTGDPKIELARRLASQHHDEAEAQASAKARFDSPRFVPGIAEQPDSVAAIDRELFAPIRKQYGVPEPHAPVQHEIFRPVHGPNGEVGTVNMTNNDVNWLTKGKIQKEDRPYMVKDEATGVTSHLTEAQNKLREAKIASDKLVEERKKLAAGWDWTHGGHDAHMASIAKLDSQIKALGFDPETGNPISAAPVMTMGSTSGFTPQTNRFSRSEIYMGPNPVVSTNRVRRYNPATGRIE